MAGKTKGPDRKYGSPLGPPRSTRLPVHLERWVAGEAKRRGSSRNELVIVGLEALKLSRARKR